MRIQISKKLSDFFNDHPKGHWSIDQILDDIFLNIEDDYRNSFLNEKQARQNLRRKISVTLVGNVGDRSNWQRVGKAKYKFRR